jgi:hypothetical protein
MRSVKLTVQTHLPLTWLEGTSCACCFMKWAKRSGNRASKFALVLGDEECTIFEEPVAKAASAAGSKDVAHSVNTSAVSRMMAVVAAVVLLLLVLTLMLLLVLLLLLLLALLLV